MINEVAEVRELLQGNNISKNTMYRTLSLLARYFKHQDMEHVKVREEIFKWANANKIYITYDLNPIIYRAIKDGPLKENEVNISESDIEKIKRLFDYKGTRLAALSILCYAKAYADKRKTFDLSSVPLADWLGVHSSWLRRRCIKELVDFGYLSYCENSNPVVKMKKYKINVSIENRGKYKLVDNDIHKLYEECF